MVHDGAALFTRVMSHLVSTQAARWHELNTSVEARMIRARARDLIADARSLGLRVEIVTVSDGLPRMGGHHEQFTVTPSREGYQSTY